MLGSEFLFPRLLWFPGCGGGGGGGGPLPKGTGPGWDNGGRELLKVLALGGDGLISPQCILTRVIMSLADCICANTQIKIRFTLIVRVHPHS